MEVGEEKAMQNRPSNDLMSCSGFSFFRTRHAPIITGQKCKLSGLEVVLLWPGANIIIAVNYCKKDTEFVQSLVCLGRPYLLPFINWTKIDIH